MTQTAGLSPEMREMIVQTLRQVVQRDLPDATLLGLDARDEFPVAFIRQLLSPDVGLHLIITRRVGGAARAMYEPVLQRLRELDTPGVLMSGNQEEGVLLGNLKPTRMPPGRGRLIRRADGVQLVQIAWLEP